MSIRFIVTPYDPTEWENATSGLTIDPKQFSERLKAQWTSADIEITPKGGVKWHIPLSDSAGFFGVLQSNKQVVTFGPGDWVFFKEFVIWYREQVPDSYTLYLFNSSSTNSLLITTNTTVEHVNNFIDGGKGDK
jgi:hypothetical protein